MAALRLAIGCWITLAGGSFAADNFPAARNTQPETAPFNTPAEALAKLRMPPGFKASLFAAEPDVRQPIAMTFDPRGRMWVAENYTYAEQPLRFDRTHKDRIIVLEDVNGDGKAEKRTVFHDQFQGLTSVEVGFGGVWALCPPQLFFIPDADQDLKPDADPIVVLDGFEVGPSNTHNFANGLKWGPDGWLYGRVGITAPGKIGLPGAPPEQRVDIGPSIWRFHPVSKAVEEVCTGTTNPWGHDWDEHGQMFFINTVIGHLWHVVPGAHYRRMFGADRNPYVYQVIEQTADHFHWDTAEAWNEAKKGVSASTSQAGGGHAHVGMMIYQGDNWPAEYRGKLFTLNMHGYRVNVDRLERHGATYVGKHDADMIFSDDPYFRGTEISYGPDGGVYILDWSDIGECHENDGVHRTSGRIFKITYGDVKPLPTFDLATLKSTELVGLLSHKNEWFARQALQLLQQRSAAGKNVQDALPSAQVLLRDGATTPLRLKGLWASHALGGDTPESLEGLLDDKDEHIRVWALRLLMESSPNFHRYGPKFVELAKQETSGLVLVTLAAALPKLPPDARCLVAAQLAQHTEFVDDRVFPLMVWYGVEGAVTKVPTAAAFAVNQSKIPLVRQFIARRLTQDLQTSPKGLELMLGLVKGVKNPELQRDVLLGINLGLQGWRKVEPPAAWASLQPLLEAHADPAIQQLSREISVVFGDGRAMDQLRSIALAGDRDISMRRAAIASLVEARPDDLNKLLRNLLNDRDLSPEAIRGLAAVNDPETSKVLIDNFHRFYPAGKEAAVQTLAARPNDALALLTAMDAGKIGREYVPVYLVRQLQNYELPEAQALVTKLWPELRPISEDKKRRIGELKQRMTPDLLAQADPAAGRRLWEKSCGKCHVLFGEGGKIGPDLTGSQRHNLDYLLENVVDPSATLAPQFRMTTIELDSGRVISGVVLAKSEQTWDVQTPTEKLTIRVSEIEESKPSTQSLMPEGLLDLLKPEEVHQLFSYVMSPRQVLLKP